MMWLRGLRRHGKKSLDNDGAVWREEIARQGLVSVEFFFFGNGVEFYLGFICI
jgi:hypothetical protein